MPSAKGIEPGDEKQMQCMYSGQLEIRRYITPDREGAKVKKILCLDDEPSVLNSLRRLLMDEEDYDLSLASSAEDALKLLHTIDPALIISDYRMPDMNGVEFLKRAKELRPKALRIILSGYADARIIVQLINDGEMYKFIPKPWDDQEMLVTIRRALEQHDLQRENERLARTVMEQNARLQQMNEELEARVAERTRDLMYNNQALEIAQKILDKIRVGILGVDEFGIVVQANEMACALLNTPLGDLLGQAADQCLPRAMAAPVLRLFDDTVIAAGPEERIASNSDAQAFEEEGILYIPLLEMGHVYGAIIQIPAQACLGGIPAKSDNTEGAL